MDRPSIESGLVRGWSGWGELDASSLLPGKRGREPEVPVLEEVREQLLSSCIQDFYLQPERPRLAALVLEVQRRFAERDLLPETLSTKLLCRWQLRFPRHSKSLFHADEIGCIVDATYPLVLGNSRISAQGPGSVRDVRGGVCW